MEMQDEHLLCQTIRLGARCQAVLAFRELTLIELMSLWITVPDGLKYKER